MSMAAKRVKNELRSVVDELSARGLQKAASWTLEQILGMETDSDDGDVEQNTQSRSSSPMHQSDHIDQTGNDGNNIKREDVYAGMNPEDVDLLQFAKLLLCNGEYQRCAYLLQTKRIPSHNPNRKSKFNQSGNGMGEISTEGAPFSADNSFSKADKFSFFSVHVCALHGW